MLVNPTVETLHTKLLEHIGNSYDKTEGYLTYDMSKAVAIEQKVVYDAMNQIYTSIDVEKLQGDDLERFIIQRKGIYRKQATYAEGRLMVRGNATIPIGAIFETQAGTQFKAYEATDIVGSGYVKIRAAVSGTVGNVAGHTICFMPITIAGVGTITNDDPTIGGYEAEGDISLRERYYLALRTPPTSGNKYHYEMWAKAVEGVGDAKVYPLDKGHNTVSVIIIDAERQPPTNELIEKVQLYIDPQSEGIGAGEAPIGARCYVEGAEAVVVDVALTATLANGYVQEQVIQTLEKNITEHLKEIAFRQTYLSHARIGAIILETDGVVDYSGLSLNGLHENVSIGERQVFTLGGIQLV